MLKRICLGLLLLVGCGGGSPPPAPPPASPPPEAPVAEPVVAQRGPDLGAAIPSFALGYLEARAGANGGALVFETLYQSLGGDQVPTARDLLDQAEVAGIAGTDPEQDEIVLVVRIRDPKAFEAWVTQAGMNEGRERHEGVDRFPLPSPRRLAWIPSERLFILGSINLVEGCIETLRGEGSSLVESGVTVPADTDLLFVANLPRITEGIFSAPLVGRMRPGTDAIEADMTSAPLLPGLSLRALPQPKIAERLPAQTVAYLTVGGLASPGELKLGDPLADDLLRRVEQATLFFLVAPGFRMAADASNVASGMAGGLLLEWKPGQAPDAAQRATLAAQLPPDLRLTWREEEVVVAAGAPKLLTAVAPALDGKHTLRAAPRLEAPGAQARMWFDMNALLEPLRDLLPPDVIGTWSGDVPQSELALTLTSTSDPWHHHFDGNNVLAGVALAGTASALIIYSVRRYLVQAKVDEATAEVRSIAEAAARAHARQGKLCPSASPVPPIVPAAKKYLPSQRRGEDFHRPGWRCLGFERDDPLYYQLAYRRGGPGVKSAVDGGTLPAGAFEAIARGDLDGDGEQSLVVVRGDVRGGTVAIQPEPFLLAPLE